MHTCWSKNISFKSKLALNINTLECILTSVIEEGGREFATPTKPTLAKPGSNEPCKSPPTFCCFIFKYPRQ